MELKPKVLILSSVSISVGPAKLAEDLYLSLCSKGVETDLLLPYKESDHPEYLYIYESWDKRSLNAKIRGKLFTLSKKTLDDNAHHFFFHSDYLAPFPTHDVLAAIKKKYDLVITLFWQDGFSFRTMRKIHNRLKCQFMFYCVDYSTMTGGCHFVGSCEGYRTGCGHCVSYKNSLFDCTKTNVRYRSRFISDVKPILRTNLYMWESFYSKSFLWRGYEKHFISKGPIINTEYFCPREKSECKLALQLPATARFVIMIGCQELDVPRKGMNYLLDALLVFRSGLTDQESSSVIVIALGKNFSRIKDKIPFSSVDLGYRRIEELPLIYNAASCFVCPSIDDAGPMMVNQSLCCGTPVVGFDMGAVKSVVKNQGTGYCARLKDSKDLARGIDYLFRLTDNDNELLQKRCRKVALETSSFAANAESILDAYQHFCC